MSGNYFSIDKPFDLEKIRLEEISNLIKRALAEFEDNPGICWTQSPMEKPLWKTLQIAVEKQIEEEPNWEGPTNEAKDDVEAYCPKCDYYLKDELLYCPDCGQKILWP